MQQIVVDVIHLQLLHRVQVHLFRLLKRPEVVVEVGELRGYEILTALVATEGDTRTTLRLTLAIDRGGVEVVQAMLDGIVDLFIDHVLIELIAIVHLCRQAHHAIA